jgi:hypothetical protein
LTAVIKGEKEFNHLKDDEPYTCHSQRTPDPTAQWSWAPAWGGSLMELKNLTMEGNCFESIEMIMAPDESNPNQFKVAATAKNKRSLLCSEYIFIANTEIYHYEVVTFGGNYEWTFNIPSEDTKKDILGKGLETYLLCETL